MKNLVIATALLLTCMACKKNYTCNCSVITSHVTGYPDITDQSTYKFKTKSKSDAQTKCDAVWSGAGVYSYSCTIQ